jgi:translocator protein
MGKIVSFMLSVLVCLGAGGLGSIFTAPSVKTWYSTINKPSFNPPNWIFGPVWTALFIMMGIALFIVWESPAPDPAAKKIALAVFFVQLALNVSWSAAFFGFHSPAAGLVVIAALWAMILWNIVVFMNIAAAAGWLLVPYILWVSFASVLNLSIVLLNK